jgi:hypothetical protein
MTPPHETILAFIEKNQPVAIGTIRDCFPLWGIEGILGELESAGLVSREMRRTIQGEHPFYRINKTPH